MEWLIQGLALFIALFLAVVKSLHYAPGTTSDFELRRLVEEGNEMAQTEIDRRHTLPMLIAMQRLKEVLLVALLAALLLGTHTTWLGLVLTAGYLLLAELVAARGWVTKLAGALQRAVERTWARPVAHFSTVIRPFAPTLRAHEVKLGSRRELQQLIAADEQVLTAKDRARVLGALEFGGHTVAGIMVPRERVVSVESSETVGPVLLDNLHRAGYNIFPVIKKDLDHLQGLLYVGDIAAPDPEVKTVKDALRPTVYYLPESAPLEAVITASMQTGRQFFMVVNDAGSVTGLITLRDALLKLMGSAAATEVYTATDPKAVRNSG